MSRCLSYCAFVLLLAACNGGDNGSTQGTLGNACRDDGTCDEGLDCDNQVCVTSVGPDAMSDPDAMNSVVDAATADASNNTKPIASFTINPTCTTSNSDVITFTSTSTDADVGDSLSCSWTLSSGTPNSSSDCVVQATFPNVAPYNITLTVTDSEGATDSAMMTIQPCA